MRRKERIYLGSEKICKVVFGDAASVINIAKKAFVACGCRGVTRVDFRVTPEGKMYVLELNTSPGMTGHSLVPKAAAELGIPFPDLCVRILETATHD